MNKPFLVIKNSPAETKLHNNIIEILFMHKKEISIKLGDIKGLYFIDHIAITIVNPKNEVMIFSYTPSVEYNLIVQDLWRYDKTFNPLLFDDGIMTSWSSCYKPGYADVLRSIKEDAHQFTYGINLIRKIGDHVLVYSYATRKKDDSLALYYNNIEKNLFSIGDYGYNLIRDIYSRYNTLYHAPFLATEKSITKTKPHLKLIINPSFSS